MITKNFHLSEFFPKDFYQKWGDASIWFIDPRIISLAQYIRDYFDDVMTINDGDRFNYRGFDPPGGYRKATSLSQHRFGRAIDFNIKGVTPDEIRDEILKNEHQFRHIYGLTTLEDGKYAPTWVHADIRETKLSKIKIVKP